VDICGISAYVTDPRDEWDVEPQQIVYSPPIISSLVKSGDFGNLSGYGVVQNDYTVQYNDLRNSNFNEFIRYLPTSIEITKKCLNLFKR
jgi:hypothetical protein